MELRRIVVNEVDAGTHADFEDLSLSQRHSTQSENNAGVTPRQRLTLHRLFASDVEARQTSSGAGSHAVFRPQRPVSACGKIAKRFPSGRSWFTKPVLPRIRVGDHG